jgi:N-acetyl sugar amidotransferase
MSEIATRRRAYKVSGRCVMDTSDPEITFDQNGHCSHCTEFLLRRARHKYNGSESDEAFEKMIAEIKRSGRGRRYDCVIGVSGGADSSYLAYVAKEHGLRPLAVHMDNGWNSEEAVGNIKKLTRKLGIDYESVVLDWEEFRDVQLAFLKASVPEAETPTDLAIAAALHNVAARYDVKYIVSGGNLATEGILPKSWHYNAKDLKYFEHIQRTFGTRQLRIFPTFGYNRDMYFKLVKGMRTLYLLNLVPFSKEDSFALLQEKLDWKNYGGKHYESKYTMFVQSYYLYEKFGIDYRRATLSTQICCGMTDRGEALEALKCKPYTIEQVETEKQYISKKLGVGLGEFEAILKLPPKWWWDYPNDDVKLAFVYDTYRKLFKKEKLGSF